MSEGCEWCWHWMQWWVTRCASWCLRVGDGKTSQLSLLHNIKSCTTWVCHTWKQGGYKTMLVELRNRKERCMHECLETQQERLRDIQGKFSWENPYPSDSVFISINVLAHQNLLCSHHPKIRTRVGVKFAETLNSKLFVADWNQRKNLHISFHFRITNINCIITSDTKHNNIP